uniref:Uncharacterized protein n=1 Tax=Oryza brachyantha TaxID=4533 RepID=J3MG61_ORYBR
MRAALSSLVSDSTVRAVMGDRCKHREAFLRENERTIELASGFNPADLWPSSRLAGWLSGAVRRAEKCRDTVFGILDGIIQERLERTAEDAAAAAGDDLLDGLLRIQEGGGLQFPLDMEAIKAVIFDIFSAGSETSVTTLEWVIAELVRNPNAMKKATAEVRRAFAGAGAVSEGALGELRYLQHVLVNVWALGRDERYWPGGSPEEFRPERFEDDGPAAGVDFRGANFELLPFGGGRADPSEFDMSVAFGLSGRRKASLLLRPTLRFPVPGF